MKAKQKSNKELPRVGLTQLRRQFRNVVDLIDQAGAVVVTERGIPVGQLRRVRLS